MQRYGNESVGEYRLVKKNGVDAVGKEHRAAVALRETFFNEGMAPSRDLFNGFYNVDRLPRFFRRQPEGEKRQIRALFHVVRQEFRQHADEIEFAAAGFSGI